MARETVLYHFPRSLETKNQAASSLRPVKLLEALESKYDVFKIVGGNEERRENIIELKVRLKKGHRFKYLYSESVNAPLNFSDWQNGIVKYWGMDHAFFRLCKEYAIPAGVFYRDIYWAFPELFKLGWKRKAAFRYEYAHDLAIYNKTCQLMFVPSAEFGRVLSSFIKLPMVVLPPATDITATRQAQAKGPILNMLYIGGIGAHYGFHDLVSAISEVPSVCARFAVRDRDLARVIDTYNMPDNAKFVKADALSLDELYKSADIALLYFDRHPYMDLAMPYKLFEYIGYLKPIIARSGTAAGNFVSSNNIGWTVNSVHELVRLMGSLNDDRSKVSRMVGSLESVRENNHWSDRVDIITKTLSAS